MVHMPLVHAKKLSHARIQTVSSITEGVVTVATACSGTDIAVLVLKAALDELCEGLAIRSPKLVQLYARDNASTSHKFILEHLQHPPRHFFKNLEELACGFAHDMVSGQSVPVPEPDIFICGFSCKTISGLNTSRSQHAGKCLEKQEPTK